LAKLVPPEPHRFMADIDASLEQQILDLPERQWIADVFQHHQAYRLGRVVELSEGVGVHLRYGAALAPSRRFALTAPREDFWLRTS